MFSTWFSTLPSRYKCPVTTLTTAGLQFHELVYVIILMFAREHFYFLVGTHWNCGNLSYIELNASEKTLHNALL